MNKIEKIQKLFHTDKWWGKVLLMVFFYFLFVIIWFNFLIPFIFNIELSSLDFFNFKELNIFYSVKLFFSIFQIFTYPAAILDPLVYYFSIIPILGSLFVNKLLFKIFLINSKIIKILFFVFSFIFILIMLRFLIVVILSSISPNFF